jgi:hypothetical protein
MTWPRTGSHYQNQIVLGNTITFVKFGSADAWETWVWDDNYIYHYEDHSGTTPYVFSDGRWAKRLMQVGEKLHLADNRITYLDRAPGGCVSPHDGPFPYEMKLLWQDAQYDAGPHIGKADVIALQYDPSIDRADRSSNDALFYEVFYFARGWGWFKWEAYRADDGVRAAQSVFDTPTIGPVRASGRCRPLVGIDEAASTILSLDSAYPAVVATGQVLTLTGSGFSNYVRFVPVLAPFNSPRPPAEPGRAGDAPTRPLEPWIADWPPSTTSIYRFGDQDGVVRLSGDQTEITIRIPETLPPGSYRIQVEYRGQLSDGKIVTVIPAASTSIIAIRP